MHISFSAVIEPELLTRARAKLSRATYLTRKFKSRGIKRYELVGLTHIPAPHHPNKIPLIRIVYVSSPWCPRRAGASATIYKPLRHVCL